MAICHGLMPWQLAVFRGKSCQRYLRWGQTHDCHPLSWLNLATVLGLTLAGQSGKESEHWHWQLEAVAWRWLEAERRQSAKVRGGRGGAEETGVGWRKSGQDGCMGGPRLGGQPIVGRRWSGHGCLVSAEVEGQWLQGGGRSGAAVAVGQRKRWNASREAATMRWVGATTRKHDGGGDNGAGMVDRGLAGDDAGWRRTASCCRGGESVVSDVGQRCSCWEVQWIIYWAKVVATFSRGKISSSYKCWEGQTWVTQYINYIWLLFINIIFWLIYFLNVVGIFNGWAERHWALAWDSFDF